MHHIIYMSWATREMSHTDLVALLQQARTTNEQLGITGVLVYGDQQFMQLLEGEQPVISTLYQRIAQDSRHRNVFKMADKAIQERTFQDWAMAFHVVSGEQLGELTGYLPPDWLDEILFDLNSVDTLALERMRELIISSKEAL